MGTLSDSVPQQDEMKAPAATSRKLESSNCFACSPGNARGLKLNFQQTADGAMIADWVPEMDFEGYQGIVHGGIVSTVLDEAMAKVVDATGIDALTAELRVRFRKQVQSGSSAQVMGWIESRERRMLKTEASIVGQDGNELAHAWAVFLTLR
jgi:acyl-coenzyme A thioesterase PaaI-like protein